MRILVLTTDYPASTRRPGSPRLYNICRELASRHFLVLGVLRPTQGRLSAFAEDNARDAVFGSVSSLPALVPGRARDFRWLVRRICHRLMFAPSYSKRLLEPDYVETTRMAVSAAVATAEADVVIVDGISCFQYVPADLPVPLVVDLCDCASWLVAQLARHEKGTMRRVSLYLESKSIRREERTVLLKSALVLTISEVDATALETVGRSGPVLVVGNGVDLDYFAYSPPAFEARTIIFSGVMEYQPNSDAAVYFAREILPAVRAKVPDARFVIVGTAPPPAVLALATPGVVTVTGDVDDVRPYLRGSSVFVCPLRIGAGVKNKILSAMAVGVPVVANSLSLSGIPVSAGRHVLVAETVADFAEKISSVLLNCELAEALSRQGRAFVEQERTWPLSVARYEAVYRGLT